MPDLRPSPADDTMKVGGNADNVASGARAAVDTCALAGYEVAIATAGCRKSFIQQFLEYRVDGMVFNELKVNSPAVQVCQPTKSISLRSIEDYYGVAGAPGCVVLMDNNW